MVSRASGKPAVHYLVGAVLAAVLLGDGLMLVGYTTQVRGRALSAPMPGAPGSSPEAAAPLPLSPPLLPEEPRVPESAAPGIQPPAPVAPAPAAPAPVAPPARSAPGSASGRHWPDSLPDPDAVARQERGRSPFTQRCASGEISARWCRGFPGEH